MDKWIDKKIEDEFDDQGKLIKKKTTSEPLRSKFDKFKDSVELIVKLVSIIAVAGTIINYYISRQEQRENEIGQIQLNQYLKVIESVNSILIFDYGSTEYLKEKLNLKGALHGSMLILKDKEVLENIEKFLYKLQTYEQMISIKNESDKWIEMYRLKLLQILRTNDIHKINLKDSLYNAEMTI